MSTSYRVSFVKFKAITTFMAVIPFSAQSHAGVINPSSSMTTGPTSSHTSTAAAFNNPAMNAIVLSEEKKWRWSYLPTIGFNLEIGPVDNFIDDLDELIDIIDDPSSSSDSSDEILDRFNSTLIEMGETGYIYQNTHISMPLMPFFFRSDTLGGVLGFGANASSHIRTLILDAPLSFNNVNGSFDTSTSLYIKTGIEKQFYASFSRPIFEKIGKGILYAGAKLKFINLDLSKQITQLQALDGADIDTYIQEEYDRNLQSTTQTAIDLGIVWDAHNYRVGLVLENLNSPSFDYGVIGENCTDNTPNEPSSCQVSAEFIQVRGEVSAHEIHKKNALFRTDALYKLSDKWIVSGALDLATYDDAVSFENQWMNISTSYDTQSYLFPSVRVGYQKNLAGTQTSSLMFGLTLFKYLNFDMEYGTESVEVDDSNLPRRLGFSISLEENF